MRASEMISALEQTGDFRVLRRFKQRDAYGEVPSGSTGRACVLDFETTGVGPDDKPFEIGMVVVEYDMDSGRIGRVLDRYHGLEDPGFPLPENIKLLTGATDEELKGKKFDAARIEEVVRACGILIPHNAEFDRAIGERRFACMTTKPWGCSMADVPWQELGFFGRKLEVIAMQMGVFYDAHRAPVDAEVTAWVLSNTLSDGRTPLWHVLSRARRTNYRVWAIEAPFKAKDILKARDYKWRDGPQYAWKAWRIETIDLFEELRFLEAEIYGAGAEVIVEELSARERFTERRAAWEPVILGQRRLAGTLA